MVDWEGERADFGQDDEDVSVSIISTVRGTANMMLRSLEQHQSYV